MKNTLLTLVTALSLAGTALADHEPGHKAPGEPRRAVSQASFSARHNSQRVLPGMSYPAAHGRRVNTVTPSAFSRLRPHWMTCMSILKNSPL